MAEKAARADARPADLVGGAFIVLTSLQFGAVVVLGELVTGSGLPVPSLLAIRFAIAAGVLAVVVAALRYPLAAAQGEGWRLAVLGIAGYALEAALFFAALRHGSPSVVTLLFFTYPVWVSVLAVLTGKGFPGRLLGGALLAAVSGAAVVVLSSGGVTIDGIGVLLALGSALAFSLYLAGADAVLKHTNSLTGAMWVSAAAGGGLAIYALVSGSGEWPRAPEWGRLVAMGVFTSGAFIALFAGLRRLGAVRTSIVAASEPLAAAALAAIFLGERIRAGTVLGGALILAGAVAASLARRPLFEEPPVP